MKLVDTTPYTVTTRKNGCEVWVTNDNWNVFIGECYKDTNDKTIADVIRKVQYAWYVAPRASFNQ